MKFKALTSIVHNAADSLASGMGFMIGVYGIDIFGEAGRSTEGTITVDFLTGRVVAGVASASLVEAVQLYRTAFDELCVKHGVEPWSFKAATAKFGTDRQLGQWFETFVEDRDGRTSTDRYFGLESRRL
ncbi:hypothetical protein [Brevundimonas sp.]|uniref:hypothetical protein n=1 Tax=Brevundimonas sp. TaxID=1871086 RepID=UPI0026257D88|nr:hypothetical protein [Brevundimonas sp.]